MPPDLPQLFTARRVAGEEDRGAAKLREPLEQVLTTLQEHAVEGEEYALRPQPGAIAAAPQPVLYTFGVGVIIDLPNLSVMIIGLNDWLIEQGSLRRPARVT